jgi:hypothetical protein
MSRRRIRGRRGARDSNSDQCAALPPVSTATRYSVNLSSQTLWKFALFAPCFGVENSCQKSSIFGCIFATKIDVMFGVEFGVENRPKKESFGVNFTSRAKHIPKQEDMLDAMFWSQKSFSLRCDNQLRPECYSDSPTLK